MNNFPLRQKKVAATGKLQNYTRKSLMAMLSAYEAYPSYNVSRRTDVLIVGTKPGSKLQKAHAFGTLLLSEIEFEAMLSQYEISPERTHDAFVPQPSVRRE